MGKAIREFRSSVSGKAEKNEATESKQEAKK